MERLAGGCSSCSSIQSWCTASSDLLSSRLFFLLVHRKLAMAYALHFRRMRVVGGGCRGGGSGSSRGSSGLLTVGTALAAAAECTVGWLVVGFLLCLFLSMPP